MPDIDSIEDLFTYHAPTGGQGEGTGAGGDGELSLERRPERGDTEAARVRDDGEREHRAGVGVAAKQNVWMGKTAAEWDAWLKRELRRSDPPRTVMLHPDVYAEYVRIMGNIPKT